MIYFQIVASYLLICWFLPTFIKSFDFIFVSFPITSIIIILFECILWIYFFFTDCLWVVSEYLIIFLNKIWIYIIFSTYLVCSRLIWFFSSRDIKFLFVVTLGFKNTWINYNKYQVQVFFIFIFYCVLFNLSQLIFS